MEQGHLLVQVRMPPGVLPGAHEIRLKIGTSGWSRPERFYVDLPPITGTLRVASVQDGVTWTASVVDWGKGGWLTIWVDGLSPEADCGNTKVFVAGVPHYPQAVVPTGQVNVRLRPIVGSGAQELFLEHRGILSDAVSLEVIGSPPIISGLEKLAATRG
jgi:hypothetical protein